jgi:hypothetical protein
MRIRVLGASAFLVEIAVVRVTGYLADITGCDRRERETSRLGYVSEGLDLFTVGSVWL